MANSRSNHMKQQPARPGSWENSYSEDSIRRSESWPSQSTYGIQPVISFTGGVPVTKDQMVSVPVIHQYGDSNSYRSPFPAEDIDTNAAYVSDMTELRRRSHEDYLQRRNSQHSNEFNDYAVDTYSQRGSERAADSTKYHTRRRVYNQDEFDGPSQVLPLPLPQQERARSQDMPTLPISLELEEQDRILQKAEDILSECAYHFVAKYQFPIPLERDKPRVRSSQDRDWTEWAYLLKRLATKRRIPARVLYDNQIKQLVTTLENSIAARRSCRKDHQSIQKLRDDRYVLQLISAGTQVARILMDSVAMDQLSILYQQTEAIILDRRQRSRSGLITF